ncbi:MAG: Na+/H+ antiporter NhaC family protein [Gammaproteobacteria bacterium]|nr:Na+/H+ antiporter NhaC family protein [Gammaproteobacteria bacterium]MBT8094858.1 Na+/H+ antiporter NhaC family protein [Gammaproteobacteria bacterium]
MLRFVATHSCRNNDINTRKLVSRNPLRHRIAAVLIATFLPVSAQALELETPAVGLADVPLDYTVTGANAGAAVILQAGDTRLSATADADGKAEFADVAVGDQRVATVTALSGGETVSADLRVIPGWVSILPAVLAISIALTLRNVVPALLIGLWVGATALQSFTLQGAGRGLLDSFQVFVTSAIADFDRASIILFTMMIGGMVGIITRNGGMASIVRSIVSKAKTAVGAQVAVWLMGLMIFFDDYSNTLVVGNTARSLTDHLKISREKLAYIVDSTAAPVACIALITTWIGYQIGLVDQALASIDALSDVQAFSVFIHSIPYSFYPILAITFVLMIASSGLDFGPMYKAEVRARNGSVKPETADALPAIQGDELEPKDNIPLRALNAFIPIIALIVGLLVSLVVLGEGNTIIEVLETTSPFQAMMYSSFVGVLVAAALTIGQRILTIHETVDAWYGGLRATLFGMIILVLAWSLSDVTSELNTAQYLVTLMADTLPVALIPAIVFVLAAITAFTTGTSWGTMAILMPLIIPLSWAVMGVNGMADAEGMHIMYSAVACTLGGAVWGDHCSPISDTTVLSSVASGCDHIEHVRTQLPYALLVGFVGLGVGTIPGGFGFPPWLSIVIGIAILVIVLRFLGRKAEATV